MKKYTNTPLFTIYIYLLLLISHCYGAKHNEFKTCDQSSFCKRNRLYADNVVKNSIKSPYAIDESSIQLENGILTANILKSIINKPDKIIKLPLELTFLENGVCNIKIDEEARLQGKINIQGNDYQSKNLRKERYNEAREWALVPNAFDSLEKHATLTKSKYFSTVIYGPKRLYKVVIHYNPFKLVFYRDSETLLVVNDRGLFNLEHWRPKPTEENKLDELNPWEVPENMWEEEFGQATDSKPFGPESVALDISFVNFQHVFGIPEHADSFSLRETRGGPNPGAIGEPYRLYNVDIFEYEVNSPMSTYGAIPFMQAVQPGSAVGIFWLNPAETWIDITKSMLNPHSVGNRQSSMTHWISESGVIDLFIMLGANPDEVFSQYSALTGTTTLPQLSSIGYHQCRWNYKSQDDVLEVSEEFDHANIPLDVVWLDIDYTDKVKYFTWDSYFFHDPEYMLNELDKSKRKLVTIIDPHIKVDEYPVYKELKSKQLAVLTNEGKDYEGECWPGKSVWVDSLNPAERAWWATLHALDAWVGKAKNIFFWNDMNEPSVFKGPETTMPRDNIHYGEWEHRALHNLYGLTYVNSTYDALLSRHDQEKGLRPFILTRSFFAGSQRYGPMWTGDNQASWDYLKIAIPMILTNGIAGMPFAGADVGGFFGDPAPELLCRWYQSAVFYPFFRAHAHIETKRREPYLFEDPWKSILRDAILLRYSLSPTMYTAFHSASVHGGPILKPMYVEYPNDEDGYPIDEQFFLGSSGMLVRPVLSEGVETVPVYFPKSKNKAEIFYDYYTNEIISRSGGAVKEVSSPLSKLPLFVRGGSIISRRDRYRRSLELTMNDPFTLVIYLDVNGRASGTIYVDDYLSFAYKDGSFINKVFNFNTHKTGKMVLKSKNVRQPAPAIEGVDIAKKNQLAADAASEFSKSIDNLFVEKIIIIGSKNLPKSKEAEITQNGETWKADVAVDQQTDVKVMHIRNPKILISEDWIISF